MVYRPVDLIEVRAFGQLVGAIAPEPRTRFYAFEYDPQWRRNGPSLGDAL